MKLLSKARRRFCLYEPPCARNSANIYISSDCDGDCLFDVRPVVGIQRQLKFEFDVQTRLKDVAMVVCIKKH